MTAFQWVETREVVVVGTGAAGLTTALSAAPMPVLVLAQGSDSFKTATSVAQGGVAAAVDSLDEDLHIQDTHVSGAYASDPDAVRVLVSEGPRALSWLETMGLKWDRDTDGSLVLGREGAHTTHRIRHAGGDATGYHISQTLQGAVRTAPHITLRYRSRLLKIYADQKGLAGLAVVESGKGLGLILTRRLVLATGGYAGIFRPTTSPQPGTGDGLWMAAEVGCELHDLEMLQFHPTTLAGPMGSYSPLLTEALRGCGARLCFENGRDIDIPHPLGPLGPRDVVSRAIFTAQVLGHRVFLDARFLEKVCHRFPTVTQLLKPYGLTLDRDLIPVTPAAHYSMGGIATDLTGATRLPGLWAVGEVASTGVHGANRLASNSLLECLVFGLRTGCSVRNSEFLPTRPSETWLPPPWPERRIPQKKWDALGRILFLSLGPLREARTIEKGVSDILAWSEGLSQNALSARRAFGLAKAILYSAYNRRESRGAHYRSDFPTSSNSGYSPSVWTLNSLQGPCRTRLTA